MFDIAFGLLMFNILHTIVGILFVLFVIVPIILNMITREGYRASCGQVWTGIIWLFKLAFGRKNTPTE